MSVAEGDDGGDILGSLGKNVAADEGEEDETGERGKAGNGGQGFHKPGARPDFQKFLDAKREMTAMPEQYR